jgi:hypothetical protein
LKVVLCPTKFPKKHGDSIVESESLAIMEKDKNGLRVLMARIR